MNASSRQAVKQGIVTIGLVSCATAVLVALASPCTSGGEKQIFTVDRTNKSDRLQSATIALTPSDRSLSNVIARAAQKSPPFGCDRVFSAAANPEQASIYKRCMT